MPVSKSGKKSGKSKSPRGRSAGQLDIIFSGPMLLVPDVSDGNITGVEVISPRNDHPVGAVFLPEVWFTDAELNDPECERWPAAASFSLLDPHSYTIDITQETGKSQKPFPVSGIPDTNHKVKAGRRVSNDWDVAVRVNGQLSGWGTQRLFLVTKDLYVGADAPTTPTAATMHRLTYPGVTGAEFCGASSNARQYLRAHAAKGGTLIVIGEIPYQASLLHERKAVDALARLAGLDMHLAATEPEPPRTRLMHHVSDCGNSIVMVPS